MTPEAKPSFGPFFQAGVIVPHLETAARELTAILGLDWLDVVETDMGEGPIRVCLSQQGPPFIELIEGPPGSAWDGTKGARIDHLAYWAEDLDAAAQHAIDNGAPLEVEYRPIFTFHRAQESGLFFELSDATRREPFYERARKARGESG
jgi:hypothetical protein